MKTYTAEKANIEDLGLLGYVKETVYNDGLDIIELWHHPCFQNDKDNGKCTHKAEAGHWKKVVK